MTVTVYDPPMCCSTGVCGADADPQLARFAGDLAWLRACGVAIERVNLAQEPARFLEEPALRPLLEAGGADDLPALVIDGQLALYGRYPTRGELARTFALGPDGDEGSVHASGQELGMVAGGCCGDEGCC
ncbi:MAG: arsenite efflux transporter metallochaperone ArsD [Trueperaceae bacterium]|nr:arsenite efflux transporter metallochaperone ArsD [Trueperaceae bacterium]